ncbi:serine-aspartate repeat-containing protein I-like isoform X2 [Cucurbita maxima]|uniref:Serine-aspartate repeat-containing protein I-like isoform X2 n=1 Tax=Cucurbita maxima TaxID=3661 RepID=A0A6J1L4V0_CUCMA|nr:serine-aspartate repeat-containing protein I-like isoform X2 [Cucurbita maxima]
MGACATKPKVDSGKVPAPVPEKNVEEKDVFVDTVAPVEAEKIFEENQSDKGKEVVDDDKVDDQSVKRRSLSHLFKEKEGVNQLCEGPAGETEKLESKETEKDGKESGTKVPQTEVETQKCTQEPETKVPQTVVETEKCVEEPETKAPQTVDETEKCIEEPETKGLQIVVKTEKCIEEHETKAPRAVVETKKQVEEVEIKVPRTVVKPEKHAEESEVKAPQTEVETEKSEIPAEKMPRTVVEPEKHAEESEVKAPQTEVETEKSEIPAEKIPITDVPTTSATVPDEKVTITSPSHVKPISETPVEKTSENVKLPKKVEKPEAVTLVEAAPEKHESTTSEQKKEDISNIGKTEMETTKERSTEPAQKNQEAKVSSEEKRS